MHNLFLYPILCLCLWIACRDNVGPRDAEYNKAQSGLVSQLSDSTRSAGDSCQSVLLSFRVASLVASLRTVLGDSVIGSDSLFWKNLDSIAMSFSSRFFMNPDPREVFNAVKSYVFTEKNILFSPNRDSLCSMLPHQVMASGKGSCMGISLLLLLLGEKLSLPIYGVLVPGHFFVRYDDGTVRFNCETIKGGQEMPDSWYREKFAGNDSAAAVLKNLTAAEVLAVVNYNAGIYLMNRTLLHEAILRFQDAVMLKPDFAECWGNIGIAQAEIGAIPAAINSLQKVREINPSLKNLNHNLGALYLKSCNFDSASAVYDRALQKDPHDPDLLLGSATACLYLRDFTKARKQLGSALLVRSNFPQAREMMKILADSLKNVP